MALLVPLSPHFDFNQCELTGSQQPCPWGRNLALPLPNPITGGVMEFKERAVKIWGMTPPCGLASSLPGGMGWQPAKHQND